MNNLNFRKDALEYFIHHYNGRQMDLMYQKFINDYRVKHGSELVDFNDDAWFKRRNDVMVRYFERWYYKRG